MDFISRTNCDLHKEYLRTLKLQMSIFEKSYPGMTGKSCREILKLPIKRSEREEAAALKADILAHELYFSSFSSANIASPLLRDVYGSEAAFVYELSSAAMKSEGFLFICYDKTGRIGWQSCSKPIEMFSSGLVPILALDLCEHAYFCDYFFDKERYVKAAVAHLDFSKIKKS